MGFGSIWHWVIVLVVVILIFGTGKLRSIGKDLGGAIKDFKKGMGEGEATAENASNANTNHDGSATLPPAVGSHTTQSEQVKS